MGLVRRNERSADVVASEPVEVLAVNESFLGRIQLRYPRIASKVFLNDGSVRGRAERGLLKSPAGLRCVSPSAF